MKIVALTVAIVATAVAAVALPIVPPETCVGDLNDDAAVSLHELVAGVAILRNERSDFCAVFDANRSGDVDVGDLVASVQDALRGCGALRRQDLSGFQAFHFVRAPALGFCPPSDSVYEAIILRQGGGLVLELSFLEEGQPGVDECLPDAIPFDQCLVVRHEPIRPLQDDEIDRVLDVFRAVAIRDAPPPECRGCIFDPCLINVIEWNSVRTTDYACTERNRLDRTQTNEIVDLLEELRNGGGTGP